MAQTRRWSVAGAPNRTTEIAHRDKRASQPESPVNKPVSGSISADLNLSVLIIHRRWCMNRIRVAGFSV